MTMQVIMLTTMTMMLPVVIMMMRRIFFDQGHDRRPAERQKKTQAFDYKAWLAWLKRLAWLAWLSAVFVWVSLSLLPFLPPPHNQTHRHVSSIAPQFQRTWTSVKTLLMKRMSVFGLSTIQPHFMDVHRSSGGLNGIINQYPFNHSPAIHVASPIFVLRLLSTFVS